MSVILVCKSDEIKNNMSHIARNFALRNRMSERFRKSGRSKKQKNRTSTAYDKTSPLKNFAETHSGKPCFQKILEPPKKKRPQMRANATFLTLFTSRRRPERVSRICPIRQDFPCNCLMGRRRFRQRTFCCLFFRFSLHHSNRRSWFCSLWFCWNKILCRGNCFLLFSFFSTS